MKIIIILFFLRVIQKKVSNSAAQPLALPKVYKNKVCFPGQNKYAASLMQSSNRQVHKLPTAAGTRLLILEKVNLLHNTLRQNVCHWHNE